MPSYIFDSTVLSNLVVVGALQLARSRYEGDAGTTVEVIAELREGLKAGYGHLRSALEQIESVEPSGWIAVMSPRSPEEHRLRLEFDRSLGAGEASCLALAVSRRLVLVTDDLAARRLAEERGVRLTGTLGILIALVREDVLTLDQANGMLATMIEQRYRSPVDRLDDLV